MIHLKPFAVCLLFALATFSAIAEPACPDFTGTYWFHGASETCHILEDASGGAEALRLPSDGGYFLPKAPAQFRISQTACSSIHFEVLEESGQGSSYSYEGADSEFELVTKKRQIVSWEDGTLVVKYRVKDRTARMFPGFTRTWVVWNLSLSDNGDLDYRHTMTKKGAALFVIPWKNDPQTTSCRLKRGS